MRRQVVAGYLRRHLYRPHCRRRYRRKRSQWWRDIWNASPPSLPQILINDNKLTDGFGPLIIPSVQLASACNHTFWSSTYYMHDYVDEYSLSHLKVVKKSNSIEFSFRSWLDEMSERASKRHCKWNWPILIDSTPHPGPPISSCFIYRVK